MTLAGSSFAQGPVLVVTENTTEQTFFNQIKLIGRSTGIIESKIVAEVAGRVESIQATEGSKVSKNQTLLTIDSETINLLYQAKEAEAIQAEQQAKLAAEIKNRATNLSKNNLISSTGLDSAIAWDAIQSAEFQKADAEKKQLQIELENCKIKAPYSGYTGRRLVDIGAWVTPGLPVFEMVDISKIKIIADLPEKYFGQLAIGSPVIVHVSSSDMTLDGKVVGVSPSASSETHTYPVIIEVTNKDDILASGMLVQVTLSLKKQYTSVAIPKDALIRQGNNTMVYTIVDGKASPIPVTITSTKGATLAVESPMLKSGMAVIVRGNERVYPGAAVTTGQEPPPAETAPSESADAEKTEEK